MNNKLEVKDLTEALYNRFKAAKEAAGIDTPNLWELSEDEYNAWLNVAEHAMLLIFQDLTYSTRQAIPTYVPQPYPYPWQFDPGPR